MQTLTDAERAAFLASNPAWRASPDGKDITRAIDFDDFSAAWAFMNRVAAIAERMDHHPDWSNSFSKVTILLTSHDARGLTRRDTTMATAIDSVVSP